MPIFARRRLQAMLDALAPTLGDEKGRDLLRRLNRLHDVDQAIPAEMELALLWALAEIGPIEVEPRLDGDTRPDALSHDLVPDRCCAIEIATPGDAALSGEAAMDRIAKLIQRCANQAEKGIGAYLYFSFTFSSGSLGGRYHRWRNTPADHVLSAAAEQTIIDWVVSGNSRSPSLHLVDGKLDVVVERRARKQVRFHNIFSSMPVETRSLTDNPLFTLLKRKARQLRSAPEGVLRLIFLADGGSTLLNQVPRHRPYSPTQQPYSATEIIQHFLATDGAKVDGFIVFTPLKDWRQFSGETDRRWAVTFFPTERLPEIPDALHRLGRLLPPPRYEGYQARSLYRQGVFDHRSRGEYLGMSIRGMKQGDITVHFPARQLLDLLAGRLSPEMFQAQLTRSGQDANLFALWLDRGMTISAAEMALRETDEDDDHIILTLTDDPAARPLTLASIAEVAKDLTAP